MRRRLWLRALADRASWGRALRVGAPVGLLQAAIHQGDSWVRLAVDPQVVLKSLLSPILSFALVWAGAAGILVSKSQEVTTRER